MINNIPYDEILKISGEIKSHNEVIKTLMKNKGSSQLEDFTSSVESYHKYLENLVELNSAADQVLQFLIK